MCRPPPNSRLRLVFAPSVLLPRAGRPAAEGGGEGACICGSRSRSPVKTEKQGREEKFPESNLQEAGKEEGTTWISEGVCDRVPVNLTQDICIQAYHCMCCCSCP